MVSLSIRLDDCVSEQSPSWKFRATLSKYRTVLHTVVRPLTSVRSTLKISPWAWASMRRVTNLGRISSAKVDRAAFSFQLPSGCPKEPTVNITAAINNTVQHASPHPGLQREGGR